jgi:hypothetical protein
MSGPNVISFKGTSKLVRAKFAPGMLLRHDDLEQLSTYTRELSRLLFRSFFGCGVVCGLVVKPETKCGKTTITVGTGLALDCNGDPIYVPKDQLVTVDEKCNENLDGPLYVLLCGANKCCAPRTLECSGEDDAPPSVCTREYDGFEIRIVGERDLPACVCYCKPEERSYYTNECKCVNVEKDPCYKPHYDGECCTCTSGGTADCCCCGECVLLARLDEEDDEQHPWKATHRVRRFIRPLLMRDPLVEAELKPKESGDGNPSALEAERDRDSNLLLSKGRTKPAAKPSGRSRQK